MSFAARSRLAAGALVMCALLAPGLPAAAAATKSKSKKVDAASVNGLRASKSPKPGQLIALDKNGKLPASVLPAGAALTPGPQGGLGPKGDKGDTGARGEAGATGATGATGTVDPSGFYSKAESDARFLQILPGARQDLGPTPEGTSALWLRLRDQYAGPSVANADFKIGNDGSLLASGNLGIGVIPASGCGYRMMWHAFKASFRAGSAGGCPGPATAWDDANTGFFSFAGGNETTASAYATFAMGDRTMATGTDAVAFGASSRAHGSASAALGYRVGAIGNFSMALGRGAVTASGCPATGNCDLSTIDTSTGFDGAFVWGDNSTSNAVAATAANQFTARAAGGFRFFTNPALTTGCSLPAGSGVLNCTSDRRAKHAFRPVDGQDVLQRLSKVPVTTWQYKSEAGRVRHMGPMAQDFRAAFGLGTDDKHIGSIDEAGVTLAAVKALYATTQRQARQIARLEREVAALAPAPMSSARPRRAGAPGT
jgi:hypothetical protein